MGIFGKSSKPDIMELYPKRDVNGLIEALGHREIEVRREVASALSMIGDERAVEPLMEALRGHKGEIFSAGDRVMFASKEYPAAFRPSNYPEKVILEYGKKATVIGEARYKGTDTILVIVRWDAGSYRIYVDMVPIPSSGLKFLDKGVAKIGSFVSTIAIDTIEKIR